MSKREFAPAAIKVEPVPDRVFLVYPLLLQPHRKVHADASIYIDYETRTYIEKSAELERHAGQ
jgi:hypothetical protein